MTATDHAPHHFLSLFQPARMHDHCLFGLAGYGYIGLYNIQSCIMHLRHQQLSLSVEVRHIHFSLSLRHLNFSTSRECTTVYVEPGTRRFSKCTSGFFFFERERKSIFLFGAHTFTHDKVENRAACEWTSFSHHHHWQPISVNLNLDRHPVCRPLGQDTDHGVTSEE